MSEENGEKGRQSTDSIPPSVLLDRILERNNRSIEEGFARLDRRMEQISDGFHQELSAVRRWVAGLVTVVIVLLMARDFVKLNLEAPGGFRLETLTQVNQTPLPTPVPVPVPVEPAPSHDTSLVQ